MLGFFPIQKIPYKKIPYKKNVSVFPIQKNYYVVHTQKITIHFLLCIFSHTKKLLCILTHKKLPYKKNVSVFSTHTKKYYVIHAKKLLVFFTIQKNYYVVHPYKKLPYKRLPYIFSHTKNYYVLHAQKNCHTFFTMYFLPYKKLLCITRKKNHIQKKC